MTPEFECCACEGEGIFWNNADPTSGQFIDCEDCRGTGWIKCDRASLIGKLSEAQRLVLLSLQPAGFCQHMGPERPNCLASCEAMRKLGIVEDADDRLGADAFVNRGRLFVRLTPLGRALMRDLSAQEKDLFGGRR